ncbi:probable alpha-methylacyl-coa racemase [Melanopsichium pennsylvanicum]|uniref:Probable alpha-methylacyl-coa racemase n=2 Tax=Melanopsichium pennsylvanicum TaxID=63383 RepID=A0AAJ5C6B8_9BASI|nr:probable alpha-methylacyl-coa racemase [Melanopsichium pennsylvanicum 4]SNX85378.1 probable alpha-methylacyl-coa racemase [Melanopsichium pennsylvanicum]
MSIDGGGGMPPKPIVNSNLPLAGIKVVEFSGLAPGPFVGMVLADFGADVIRIDRTNIGLNADSLCRGKRSFSVSPKSSDGHSLITQLIQSADVVIDPFRPGVLERLGLGPQDFEKEIKSGLVFSRLTGFQRTGPYANMAGHDINYIALSGVLSSLGTAGGKPQPPSNLLGDFAGGSMICLLGILLALVERNRSNQGQVVEADMVTGSRYVSSFTILSSYLSHPSWGAIHSDGTNESRGRNTLDGGAPWYGVYCCADGGWMSVGAIEPHFYAELLQILRKVLPTAPAGTSHPQTSTQHHRDTWPSLREYLTQCFAQKPRAEWERHFLRTDACVAPVLTRDEAAVHGVLPAADAQNVADGDPVIPSPAPKLSRTPARPPLGSVGGEWETEGAEMLLTPGEHTDDILLELGITDSKKRIELYASGAVDGPDRPEGLVKSKL